MENAKRHRTLTRLGTLATLKEIEHADHGFHCLARFGRTDEDALSDTLDTLTDWIGRLLASGR